MRISDLKYLLSYSIPLMCFVSINFNGLLSWAAFIYGFIIVPIIEQIVGTNINNDEIIEHQEEREKSLFFEVLLYLNLPIIFFLLYLGFNDLKINHYNWFEIAGKIVSLGILLGACGINVAHEIGHKSGTFALLTSKFLLTPCLYNHFTIQHNRGHHLNVGTPDDPATSRKNESIYKFWWRSVKDSYIQAWSLEASKLNRTGKGIFSFHNEMIWNTILSILYLSIVYYIWGEKILIFAIIAAIISFLLLETINYIEHYGLERKEKENGIYERVQVTHSWNSDHQIGRIVLYELTRHSDHHFKANKKYQLLLHHDASPQLPYGYPTSMLLALVPGLWFKVMNPLISKIENQ